jgi:hypothetical protein
LGWDTKAGKWKWKGGRERFVYSEGSTTLISSSFALLIRKQIFWIKMNIQ